MTELKGITLTQPWASLVAAGAKEFETRDWATRFRGTVLIHSSKRFPPEARAFAGCHPLVSPWLPKMRQPLGNIPLGCVVAIARLVECIRTEDLVCQSDRLSALEYAVGNFEPGRFAFRLERVRKLHPIPWPGALSLWPVPVELYQLVAKQLQPAAAAG